SDPPRMKTAVVVIVTMLTARGATAQPSDAARCETEANQRKSRWASTTHSALVNTVETEAQQLALTWCRARASSGEERVHHLEDFGRVLFTGDGLHPVVGTVAPSNGLAGGAVWNNEWNSRTHPLRFSTNVEGRVSLNGAWAAGAVLSIAGS